MKFSTIILSTILAALAVSAQNGTTTSSVVSGTAPLTPAQSTEAACLQACSVNDNTCRTKCIPLGSQTNGVIDCISACPKGNGTAIDNQNYNNCVQSCISNAAVSATASPTAPGATATGTSGSGSGASTDTGSATATGGSTPSGTATGSGASASASKGAADNVRIGASVVGAAGLFAALFAL